MSSIRFMSLAALALVALTSVACAPASYEEQDGQNAGSFGLNKKPANGTTTASESDEQASAPAISGEAGGAGTCEATCSHYLTCKGTSTAANQTQCVTNCKGMNLSAADLAAFEQSDCATAIATVEGTASNNGGTTNTSSNECDGCVADGSYCIWASKGDWGKQGAVSGAVIECEARCCQ